MNRLAGDFTEKQGQYLAFIYNYTVMNGRPPAIHQMILKLEEKGLISRRPAEARSIRLLVETDKIPRLMEPKRSRGSS